MTAEFEKKTKKDLILAEYNVVFMMFNPGTDKCEQFVVHQMTVWVSTSCKKRELVGKAEAPESMSILH